MEDALASKRDRLPGITVMFAVGAICSPRIVRLIDLGPRTHHQWPRARWSTRFAAALPSRGPRPPTCCLGGPRHRLDPALSTPSSSRSPRSPGPGARRAIGMLPSSASFASTVVLSGRCRARSTTAFGWRGHSWSNPPIHLFACAPIHLLCCRSSRLTPHSLFRRSRADRVPTEIRSRVFLLLSPTLANRSLRVHRAMVT